MFLYVSNGVRVWFMPNSAKGGRRVSISEQVRIEKHGAQRLDKTYVVQSRGTKRYQGSQTKSIKLWQQLESTCFQCSRLVGLPQQEVLILSVSIFGFSFWIYKLILDLLFHTIISRKVFFSIFYHVFIYLFLFIFLFIIFFSWGGWVWNLYYIHILSVMGKKSKKDNKATPMRLLKRKKRTVKQHFWQEKTKNKKLSLKNIV